MPRRPPTMQRVSTAARWPLGIALTSWRYMWRTTPVHRWEMSGSRDDDSPPALPEGLDLGDIQLPSEGTGPLVHRLYRVRITGAELDPESLIARLSSDLDQVAPS